MVHRCCISSCGMSVRVVEAKGLSYHKFPTKEPIRDQWVQAIIPHMDKPESFKVVPRYTRVCSRHFRKKDYCMDAKKRARLNSNAIPSVFPRKNTALVVPTILPVSPKLSNSKSQVTTPDSQTPSTSASTSIAATSCKTEPASSSSVSVSPENVSTTVEISTHVVDQDVDKKNFDDLLGKTELLIESASIQDEHLVLTLMDPLAQDVEISNSDDQSQDTIKVEDEGNGSKRRKRRKWNRTAFARPAKGKRKSLQNSPKCELEELQDGSYESENVIKTSASATDVGGNDNIIIDSLTATTTSETTQFLADLQRHTSLEQELLQSIQAVSLSCGGDVDVHQLHDDMFGFTTANSIPAFLHHHSSEESLFSNESQQNEQPSSNIGHHRSQSTSQSDVVGQEDDSLRFDDLRIDSDVVPSLPPTTYLDIDELAHQLNSSLFTDGKLSLFSTSNGMSLTSDSPGDLHQLHLSDDLLESSHACDNLSNIAISSTAKLTTSTGNKAAVAEPAHSSKKESSPRVKESKTLAPPSKAKAAKDQKKLKGVTKRPKKDKIVGKFCVERFKNSDKDIEYYTAFKSYRSLEAFFRSLEAYIERLCITDVTYGVNNLPSNNDEKSAASSASTSATEDGASTSQRCVEQPKKRNCQGRSMSRINELFMTIIRLRRKLPEKVLGHMFFISQPTVSRVVRAWTVLLSKIIDSYPAESTTLPAGHSEHSYTNKGLGIPDAFRDLFKSELANSIVVTSLNPKKMKAKSSASSQPKKSKPSKASPPATTERNEGSKVRARRNTDSAVKKEEKETGGVTDLHYYFESIPETETFV